MKLFDVDTLQNTAKKLKMNPLEGQAPLESHLNYVGGLAVDVTSESGHTFTIDEPTILGGKDSGASPVEHLVSAAAACVTIGFLLRAGQENVAIESLSTDVTSQVDLSVLFGLVKGGRRGIGDLTITLHIKANADVNKLEELVEASRTTSPVLNSLNIPARVVVIKE